MGERLYLSRSAMEALDISYTAVSSDVVGFLAAVRTTAIAAAAVTTRHPSLGVLLLHRHTAHLGLQRRLGLRQPRRPPRRSHAACRRRQVRLRRYRCVERIWQQVQLGQHQIR
jgi:hypothetical protein